MQTVSSVALWAALAIICLGLIAGILVWILNFRAPWQIEMLKNHYAAIVGLPAAAAGAFVVIILGQQLGPGTLKIAMGTAVDIEGPAGPVLLWVICFLAIAFAIRMIWPLKP